MNNYGLTQQEVWNLVNGFDRCELHYCYVCSKLSRFHNLQRGFPSGCCQSHTEMMTYLDKPDLIDLHSNCLNSIESQASGRRTQFLNKGNSNDPCVFYIIRSNELYKYGITADPEVRYSFKLHCDEVIKEINGTRSDVADLEYKVKIFLNQISEWISESQYLELLQYLDNVKRKEQPTRLHRTCDKEILCM